ncbi:ion channel [Dokdonella sp.]|uniref:ion channel n=1 Tax=Dokdonella sp. TaxID=2291710 RepID=UPI0035280F30
MKRTPDDSSPDSRDGRQTGSDRRAQASGTPFSHRRIAGVYGFAFLLALLLFYFHVAVIFEVLDQMLRYRNWLVENVGTRLAGKFLLLGCFFALMSAHVIEAAAWGAYLHLMRMMPSITEGTYFCAASITTLGYGDVLLKHPWRHLSTLIAITGVLMFGCSTAFLFVIVHDVWQQLLVGANP